MHNPLEQYLEDLSDSLKSLPAGEREAEIREVRQHLEFLVAQRVEHGESLHEAMRNAIHQFGSPSANGKDLKWVWQRRHKRARWQALRRNLRVLVGTRKGRAVAHWPGIILFSALIIALNVLITVAISFVLTRQLFFLSSSLAFGIPMQFLTIIVVGIQRALQMPPDQLRTLD